MDFYWWINLEFSSVLRSLVSSSFFRESISPKILIFYSWERRWCFFSHRHKTLWRHRNLIQKFPVPPLKSDMTRFSWWYRIPLYAQATIFRTETFFVENGVHLQAGFGPILSKHFACNKIPFVFICNIVMITITLKIEVVSRHTKP